jgi:hypothetical protein
MPELKARQARYPRLFTPDMEAQKTSKRTYVGVGVRTTPLYLLSKE